MQNVIGLLPRKKAKAYGMERFEINESDRG